MAIVFSCECGKELRSKDDFAGKKTRCPACGAALMIPMSEKPEAARAEPEKKPSPLDDPIAVDFDMGASPMARQAAAVNRAAPAEEPPSGMVKIDASAAGSLPGAIAPTMGEGERGYRVLMPKDYGIAAKFNAETLEKTLNDYARQGWSLKVAVVMSVPGHAGAHDELIVIMEH